MNDDIGAHNAEPKQTYNPWTIVNLVFGHLVDEGLRPVLGETGNPADGATALLRALGIEPGQDHEGPAATSISEELAELRARMFPEGEERS